MISRSILLLTILILTCHSYEQAHNEYGVMTYYQKYSYKPIIHVYFNRHFKNSTKFKLFQSTLDQLYNDNGDYLEILYTDCDQDLEHKLQVCERMRKTKDNRQIVGSAPSSEFRQIGNFLVQSPPSTQALNRHAQDQYPYDELKNLLVGIMPNFYKELNNVEEYQDYLNPRYSPKLIVFAQDHDQTPIVMKEIAVAFFLKFDFAMVSDLTQQITSKFKLKPQPSFVIIKYNFNQSKHEYIYYQETELTQSNYPKIKQFVQKYALKQQRNDILFHKIRMETSSEIVTLQTQGQLEEYKEKATGWVIIVNSQGNVPLKLFNLYQKFGRYFSYVNYVHQPADAITLYNPTQKKSFPFEGQQLQFNSLDFQDFKSNMTVWLSKGVIVLGVSPQYPHICGLAQKTLFRGHVRCLIISQDGKKDLEKLLQIDFEVGFIVHNEHSKKKSNNHQTTGNKILKDDFQQIYRDLQYATRFKLKQQLDFYLQNPVSQIKQNLPLAHICSHPFKKCLFLVTNLGKQDRTLQQYLKQTAFDFMNSFIIYEIDMDSNPQFVQAIGGIADKKADIVVYNPYTSQYIKLNKKITKNLLTQFFRANLKNDKRLKRNKSQKLGQIVIKTYQKVLQKTTRNKKNQQREEL